MRDILFRGKRTDNGEWIYGDLVHANHRLTGARIFEIWTPMPDGETDPNELEYGKVDPATIGQYTGLTDKNGKMIFEGDVVATVAGKPHEVMFADGEFFMDGTAIPFKWAVKFSVIGNIYDNPELLEEKA